ncbi:hypothetical protein NL676_018721 [Syzygium grande]|nr:hypothetical protein NL676_018721 [Syzygium grande]
MKGESIPLADDDSLQPPMGSTAKPFVQIELSANCCFQHPSKHESRRFRFEDVARLATLELFFVFYQA